MWSWIASRLTPHLPREQMSQEHFDQLAAVIRRNFVEPQYADSLQRLYDEVGDVRRRLTAAEEQIKKDAQILPALDLHARAIQELLRQRNEKV